MENKDLFLRYCKEFNRELEDLQKDIDFEERADELGTLAYIGTNFSYDLAVIGFQLCYTSWFFNIKGNFEEVKKSFIKTIMSNEKLDNLRTIGELKDIESRLLKAKENK